VIITGDDVKHLRNVLRVQQGDDLLVSDGQGRDVIASVAEVEPDHITADIIKERDAAQMPELPMDIVLYQALPKADKMELIIQKCVELGVYRIVPVETSRCVVKLDDKNKIKKLERWQKIAQSASEQSQRSIIPQVGPVMSLREALEDAKKNTRNVIAYEMETGKEGLRELLKACRDSQKESLGIFIGPEGGLTAQEVEDAVAAQIQSVSLGRRILRTETAGMALLAAVMLEIESR